MGGFLFFTISKPDVSVETIYWWPLIFAAMQKASFQFDLPSTVSQHGKIFSLEELDQMKLSFRALWGRLYRGSDKSLLLFWQSREHEETFRIETSIQTGLIERGLAHAQ